MTRRLPGYSSSTLVETLRNLQPVPRSQSGTIVNFTREEVIAILEARQRGVTWKTINSKLAIPYHHARNLNSAVFYAARRYGISLDKYKPKATE